MFSTLFVTVLIKNVSLTQKYLHVQVAKEDPQTRIVGGRAVYDFSRASSRTSCVDIMKRKGNDGQVCNLSTRAAVFVLCVEKAGSEFVTNFVTRAS